MLLNNLCFIKEEFFTNHPSYTNMLDPKDSSKQASRTHVCLKITLDSNNYFLPLRSNLGADVRSFGRIGHAVPSASRPNAGIDFRHALVINDLTLINVHTEQVIPNSQLRKINEDYLQIQKEFDIYVKGYKKAFQKNRINRYNR